MFLKDNSVRDKIIFLIIRKFRLNKTVLKHSIEFWTEKMSNKKNTQDY